MHHEKLPELPPNAELETKAVLKKLAMANSALAVLKGYADTIPNKHILKATGTVSCCFLHSQLVRSRETVILRIR